MENNMKFIPTAQKFFTDEELENIMIEIIDDLDPKGIGPLEWNHLMLTKYPDFEIPEALLTKGNGEFFTLIHMLAVLPLNRYVKEMIEFLIEHGADVNVKDPDGKTPLHYIFLETTELTDTAKFLLDNNADINAEDFEGKSPLYYVLKHNSGMDTAMELVTKYGAKITPCMVRDFGYKKGYDALRNMHYQSTSSNKIAALENDVEELKSEISVLRSDMVKVLALLKGMQLKDADNNERNVATSARMFGK